MRMNSLLSREQITAIKDQFVAVEITDADFNRTEVIGDLIRHIEIVEPALSRSRWTIPKPSAQCSKMPMITSGSPKEPKNEQQATGPQSK